MTLWDSIKAKLVCMALGACVVVMGVTALWSWHAHREAAALEEAQQAERQAAIGSAEVEHQVEAATQVLEAHHADELRSIAAQQKRDEQRLRTDPAGLSRLLVDEGRRAAAVAGQ